MKTLHEIEKTLSQHKEELKKMHKVKVIGIFGSYARGEEHEKSDVDLLVELEEPVSLLKLVGLENFLIDLIGIKVDVVPKEDIRPELKNWILEETIYI